MSDEKKTISGQVISADEPHVPAQQSNSSQDGFLTTGLQRIKKFGQLQEAKLDTKLASEKNDLGDQLVRREQIHLDLGILQTKLSNAPTIQEGVKAEVIADTMEAQQRVRNLKAAQDHSALVAEVGKAELEAKLAKAKANAAHWNSKLDGATKPGPTRKEQIATLTTKFEAMIKEYKEAREAAGGELDEASARQYDIDIGRLQMKIRDLQDAEDAGDDQPPYED